MENIQLQYRVILPVYLTNIYLFILLFIYFYIKLRIFIKIKVAFYKGLKYKIIATSKFSSNSNLIKMDLCLNKWET